MKITLDAAMRARDVSRPRAEHEALARLADETEEAGPKAAGPAEPAAAGNAPRPGQGRRRRRRR